MSVDIEQLYADIPDQTGKVAIVTGGNAGIGKVTCKRLLEKGVKVYMGARSKERAEAAIAEIKENTGKDNIHWLPMDLGDLATVRDAVENFKTQEKDLHILVNNAGIMAVPFELTKDGYESQWGTNVVGHFTLTHLLLPTLLHTSSHSPPGTVRVINLSSKANEMAPRGGIDFNDTGLTTYWYPEWRRYGQSKLGNILLTKEITRRYKDQGIISVAIHPGVIQTKLHTSTSKRWLVSGLLKYFPQSKISEDEGAYTQVFAATHPRVVTEEMNGKYLEPFAKIGSPNCLANDAKLAEKLWTFLEHDTAGKF